MKKNNSSKDASKRTFDRLAYAVGAYIKESGGNAIVVGGIRIAKRDKFRFTMEVDFTGRFPNSL